MPHKIWIKHREIKEGMDGLLITTIKVLLKIKMNFDEIFHQQIFKIKK
jgi:hypothetical protein